MVAPLNFEHARRFVSSVPEGRWTTYKDVATAGGNRRGAMAIGQWLRHNGATIPNYWRVLRADGHVPDNFTGDDSGAARDAESVRGILRQEGVSIGANGRAGQRQRYLVEQWPEYRPSLDDPGSVPEPQATAAVPHQLAASDDNALARRGTPELLRDWSMIMRELRRRDIIRTNNNPVGDIAEAIVAEYYQGQRGSFSQAGWDVKTATAERIQVKAMRQTSETKRRNLSPIRDREYDVVVVVVFDEDFVVTEGLRITREVVEELFPHRAHVNGRVIIVTQTLRQDPRVQHLDLTVAAQRLST